MAGNPLTLPGHTISPDMCLFLKKIRGLRRFRTSDLRSGVPPASCPPFVLQRGYPRERISHGIGARSSVRAVRYSIRVPGPPIPVPDRRYWRASAA